MKTYYLLPIRAIRVIRGHSSVLRVIEDYLWRRFVDFKPGAHFLNLRSLLFETCSQGLDFFLLLRDRSLEVLL